MDETSKKAILFLYEGETEGEFYPRIFKSYLDFENRRVRLSSQCLKGNFNINSKVVNSIYNYIAYLKKKDNINSIYVYVALDRDKREEFMAPIDLTNIRQKVGSNLVKSIEIIVATQDFESWLFIDAENIYKFLRTPVHLRNSAKYKNYQSFNNKDLSKLFSQNDRQYKKGKKVEGLLNSLNLEKIYENCQDLKNGIESMKACIEPVKKR